MRQFVPLTDEMLYQMGGFPTALVGPLVPYRPGLECLHALMDETAQAAVAKVETIEEPRAPRSAAVTAPGSYTSAASASP
jgi:hypothetical protein